MLLCVAASLGWLAVAVTDKIHAQLLQVKVARQQRLFPCVAAPELSTMDQQALQKQNQMRINDFMQRHCKKLLCVLMDRHFGHVFNVPVDLEKYSTYLNVVSKPMDFGTIRRKIDSNTYTSLDEFIADVNLVLDNARTFNPPNSLVYHMADALQVLAAPTISALPRRGGFVNLLPPGFYVAACDLCFMRPNLLHR